MAAADEQFLAVRIQNQEANSLSKKGEDNVAGSGVKGGDVGIPPAAHPVFCAPANVHVTVIKTNISGEIIGAIGSDEHRNQRRNAGSRSLVIHAKKYPPRYRSPLRTRKANFS